MGACGLVLIIFGAAMFLHPNTAADAIAGSFMAFGGMVMIYFAYHQAQQR